MGGLSANCKQLSNIGIFLPNIGIFLPNIGIFLLNIGNFLLKIAIDRKISPPSLDLAASTFDLRVATLHLETSMGEMTQLSHGLTVPTAEITALSIFYDQPSRRREPTYQLIGELCDAIRSSKPRLAPFAVWQAYERLENVAGKRPENELVALVSLVRRVLDIDKVLTPYDGTVNRNFQAWVMDRHKGNAPKFSEENMLWLRMIKDHIATSMHMGRDDFDYSPFAEQGGLGKAWQLFGNDLDMILEEMNEKLAA